MSRLLVRPTLLVVSVALFALTSLVSGCRKAPRPSARLLVGWDTSGSAAHLRKSYLRSGAELLHAFRGSGTRVTLFRMDRNTHEFFDGAPPGNLEKSSMLLRRSLNAPPGAAGTRPARFWSEVAARAQGSGLPVCVVLLTDGGDDDASEQAAIELRHAVRSLADNVSVLRVCLWGVTEEHRARLRREFAPLGDRLEVKGTEDIRLPETCSPFLAARNR